MTTQTPLNVPIRPWVPRWLGIVTAFTVMLPIILSIFVMMVVMKDPNSPLVFWCSMIPFTSPVVMMARIPCGIPTWEIVVSLAVLYATFMAMVWLAAKIYRVGIFMYGKKPTFKELYKWIRYKY